jgi:hypothetical protein
MRAPGDRKQKPVWALWRNPIFRRYARSRLRPKSFGFALLLTVILAGFIFALARSIGMNELEPIDAERTPLIPLLVFQGLLLFFLGTGQVAGGMTSEGDEGVLDYQRLAPMSPLAKTLGYLFGLPIREYVLFLATMPFTLWGLWRGQVPVGIAAQLYGVFLSSVVLYHLTGLVAGTVMKNRRWAFLGSMGAIFFLYTAVPQLAKFGLVYFKYLTLYPVFEECLPFLIERNAGSVVETVQNLRPPARFFNLDLPQAVFTLLSQGVFSLAAIVMVWRKWYRAESHLLGKVWSLALFGWVQIVLLGNALPLIAEGDLFPSRNMGGFLGRMKEAKLWEPEAMEAVLMAGVFGLVTLVFLLLMLSVITPDYDTQLRGWRRARKLGRRRLPRLGDSASSFCWAVAMIVLGTTGWFVFTRNVVESHWFFGSVDILTAGAFALPLVTAGLGWQALLEWKGQRAAVLVCILLGVVPVLIAVVMAASSQALHVPATWLGSASPLVGPILATISEIEIATFPRDIERAAPPAFWFWQSLLLVAAVRFIFASRKKKRLLRETGEATLPS